MFAKKLKNVKSGRTPDGKKRNAGLLDGWKKILNGFKGNIFPMKNINIDDHDVHERTLTPECQLRFHKKRSYHLDERKDEGSKYYPHDKRCTRLPILLTQVQARKISKHLLNEIDKLSIQCIRQNKFQR